MAVPQGRVILVVEGSVPGADSADGFQLGDVLSPARGKGAVIAYKCFNEGQDRTEIGAPGPSQSSLWLVGIDWRSFLGIGMVRHSRARW